MQSDREIGGFVAVGIAKDTGAPAVHCVVQLPGVMGEGIGTAL